MTTSTDKVGISEGFSPNPVIADGAGSPVVFLHGFQGQEWPAFLDDLAGAHHVYAPANPGAEEPADLELLDDMYDLVVYYDELFDALGLDGPFDLIGHSYGGMVAAEYAAAHPERVRKLVLIDSMGLWLDEVPVEDFITNSAETVTELLYADPSAPAVVERMALPEDPEEAQAFVLGVFGALASVSHFAAPIPERGLAKRLRRVRADTLLVWGEQDGLVPPRYAEEFHRLIATSQIELVPDAGHLPYVENRQAVSKRVLDFLG